MVIIKVLGMLSFIFGGILLFSAYKVDNYTIFAVDFILGPVLIYLGLQMLNYI